MNGPLPHVLPRISTEDSMFSGTFVPKNSVIAIDLYNIHHSGKVWRDTEVFNPDRFEEGGEAGKLGDGFNWLPFGGGPRQCIGMNFSLAEQRVLLSMMCKYMGGL